MFNFKEYITEQEKFADNGLTVFDIDDTLFHTTAKIAVKVDGKVTKELSNQEFNNYQLKPGEVFDFKQFMDSDKFYKESKPIVKMMNKAKAIMRNVKNKPGSQVVIITARNDFNDKQKFLKTFKKYGIDIDSIRVERAGKINDVNSPDLRKYVIIYNMLKTKQFSRVRLFDDSMANLKSFLKLKSEFPQVSFEAYFANSDGSVKVVR